MIGSWSLNLYQCELQNAQLQGQQSKVKLPIRTAIFAPCIVAAICDDNYSEKYYQKYKYIGSLRRVVVVQDVPGWLVSYYGGLETLLLAALLQIMNPGCLHWPAATTALPRRVKFSISTGCICTTETLISGMTISLLTPVCAYVANSMIS